MRKGSGRHFRVDTKAKHLIARREKLTKEVRVDLDLHVPVITREDRRRRA